MTVCLDRNTFGRNIHNFQVGNELFFTYPISGARVYVNIVYRSANSQPLQPPKMILLFNV